MPRTPYCAGRLGFSSTFTLATMSLPSYSVASSSSAGPIILQGPHHSAQKSTSTGTWRVEHLALERLVRHLDRRHFCWPPPDPKLSQ